MNPCQSCKNKPAEVIDNCDNPSFPYKVCKDCHERLLSRSLQPREYFNLSSKHGKTYLLHDDFYDNDGTACNPQIELRVDKALTFPKLAELNDLQSVVDYAIVERWLSDNVVDAIKKFKKKEILEELDTRITSNNSLSRRIYQVAAFTLGTYADEWILKQWDGRTDDNFPDFVESLAKCLTPDLGIKLYVKQLDTIDQANKLVGTMTGLMYFQSKLVLDWIEINVARVLNISDAWGYLAVASQFDWETAEKWLRSGRPLALIALDALANCAVTSDTQNSTIWLKNNPQRLLSPKPIEEMNIILFSYSERDKTPRVRTKINYIVANWHKILK